MRDLRVQTPESLEEIRRKWLNEISTASTIQVKAKEMLPMLLTEHIHSPESLAMAVGVCSEVLVLIGQASPGAEKATGITLGLKMFGDQSMQELTVDSNMVKKETHLTYEEKYITNLMPKVEGKSEKAPTKILKQSK